MNIGAVERHDGGAAANGAESVAGRRLEAALLAAVLLLALVLRLWGLEQNGWGAEYYTAAVRSMALSWHNFFYAAFDPQGFISVDKPPIALWLQVASVKLFGFHPLSVLLPQVLEGVLSVWLLFHLVRRRFSAMAALLAALFFAVTPVFVAVNRTNNMDSCLLLALLLAAWALMKAAENGDRRLLLLSMFAIGVAFNVKMLMALIVVPTFFLIYFVGASKRWQQRVLDLSLATVVLAASALPWVLAVEYTPAENRPWVGSSSRNSMLELLVGHNGTGRFVSRFKQAAPESPAWTATARNEDGEPAMRSAVSRLFVHAPTGPLRLASGQLAAQMAWLLPFALAALAIGLRKNRLRKPGTPKPLALLFWLCWIVNFAAVYSYAGGIIHFYYLTTLAPALSALAGIGVAGLWRLYLVGKSGTFALPLTLLAAVGWQLHIQTSGLDLSFASLWEPPAQWLLGLHLALIYGSSLAAVALLMLPSLKMSVRREKLAAAALGCGLSALLVVPMAWALSSVLLPGHGVLPSADLHRLNPAVRTADDRIHGRFGQLPDTSRLVSFLQSMRSGERYLLATSTTLLAAPIIITSGEAVLARGGFHGLDGALSVSQLEQMVNAKEIRFATVGDLSAVSRKAGAAAADKPVADWIREHGRPVPAKIWRARGLARDIELYDLQRPQLP